MIKTFEDAGELILGTRLKKLGEKFLNDVSAVYRELGIEFETPWFALFFTLDKYGSLTMSEIASNLGVTQSAISQTVSVLEKKGLIRIDTADEDKRIKVVSLTEKAIALITKIKPIWKSIKKEMKIMLYEGKKSKYMLQALSELEESFAKKSLTARVIDDIKDAPLKIEQYKPQYFREIKRVVFSWIFEYGLPRCDFINDLETILERNDTYVSFSNEHITAVAIKTKNNNANELFIINKNDFDDGSYLFLLKNMLKEHKNNIDKVYIDKNKKSAKALLERFGYKNKNTATFSKSSKELLMFEANNG